MVDFRSRKKKTLPVALPDGAELALKTPSKALFDKIKSISKSAGYDELTGLCADILSTNTQGRAISPADIEGLLDIDDIAYLIREYSKFVKGVISDPN